MAIEGNLHIHDRNLDVRFKCPCDQPMLGKPHEGAVWSCRANHQFRVIKTSLEVTATALVAEKEVGVMLGTTYIWDSTTGQLSKGSDKA